MAKAFGIVNFSSNRVWVEGLEQYRPIGAFSFLGRYRVIDFPISNMSNSGIDHIQTYVRRKPRSVIEHLGTGRHYNINSKKGKLHILFSENGLEHDFYNTDIAAFLENLECIEQVRYPYVVIAPSYMIYSADYKELLKKHVDSGADISLLYQNVNNAKTSFLNCNALRLNNQKGVTAIRKNRGDEETKNIFMDTYIMKKDIFISLIQKASEISSMYSLSDIVNESCQDMDIRAIAHEGFFASITDFKSYFDANLNLISSENASTLFKPDWPIYTRTNDSCPTQYFENAHVSDSVVSDGCLLEGTVKHCVIGRGSSIGKDSVLENCVILPGAQIGEGIHMANMVVDKKANVIHIKDLICSPDNPGYIHRQNHV